MIHETKIHNHPLSPDVERWVQIVKHWNDWDFKTFDMYYKIRYEKDGVDVSSQFNQEIKVWRTDNSRMMFERNLETFQPKSNPDYIAGENDEFETEFLMQPAYDYTLYLTMKTTIPNEVILEGYILEEAQDGIFDR